MGMLQSSEAKFQRAVVDLANLFGWKVASFRCVRVQRANGKTFYATPVAADGRGFPDLLLAHPGRHSSRLIVAELKIGRNKVSDEQRDWLATFEIVGVPAYTWRPSDFAEIEQVLRNT